MDEETKRIYKKYGINAEEREKENFQIIQNAQNELDLLNEDRLRNEFENGMNNNFIKYKEYLRETRFYYFTEFESNVWQVVQCLIIEAHSAAITLTNHIFERVFKLALIQNEVGVSPVNFEEWNKTYKDSHRYSNWAMKKTLPKCLKYGLIETEQFNRLTEYNDSIRNGFSHYDPSAILKNEDDIVEFVIQSENPDDQKIFPINFKQVPILQHHSVTKFARDNAEPYFDYAITIIRHIERKFKEKYYEEYKINNAKE